MLMDVKFIYFIVILDIWAHTFIFHFSSPGKMLGFVSQREWNHSYESVQKEILHLFILMKHELVKLLGWVDIFIWTRNSIE